MILQSICLLTYLGHPVSKTHWATVRRQSSLLIADCSASSQVMPILFKSWRIVSIQFFLGLPGFRLALWSACQYIACFGTGILFSMRSTCSSHLSLLYLMMTFNSSNFV